LVHATAPDFIDPATDLPLRGREDQWTIVTAYRVYLAREDRNWPEAERLQRLCVDWDRQRAEPALAPMPDNRNALQQSLIRSSGASLHLLAQIQRDQESPTCAQTYREALALAGASGDTAAQATCAFNLGHAYTNLAALRDLDEAERWYRQSLALRNADDTVGRGLCLAQLGRVAYERFKDAQTAKHSVEELGHHLTESAQLYGQALDMTPTTDVTSRGIILNQLGNIWGEAGDIDSALHHYRQCIRSRDEVGDIFAAGQTRFNVAVVLLRAGRLADALAYAVAALANFRTFGDRAAADKQAAERLIAYIEEAVAKENSCV
jgi:tetratricopeptide (TPR) repeat protein